MDIRGYQRYREDSLDTMTQGELLLLLYDELVKRLKLAEMELERQQYDTFEQALHRSVAIIHYLSDTLDHSYPISQKLDRLYEFFCYELCRVEAGRNQIELERVTHMVDELRDSFRQADKNTTSDKQMEAQL
ncbi:flagellar export chaperone FliS [Candidatus Avoscillospira sp. LCP25S3_F1]|uniref:flagellar export chaperone FliS n=1 Tax=Candidatus Avoscillospira sp. LCP25S3_F1 TaxID=3438825 RepID=UPI003F9129D9